MLQIEEIYNYNEFDNMRINKNVLVCAKYLLLALLEHISFSILTSDKTGQIGPIPIIK